MDKKEFAVFAMALRTYYPKENLLPNSQAAELWFKELQDLPMDVLNTVLRKWVQTNKWSPAISDLREGVSAIINPDLDDWGKGWKEVMHCIGRYGVHREKEALDHMSPLTRATVERLGWYNLCVSEDMTADRANFRMIYDQLSAKEAERSKLSAPVQDAINILASGGINVNMLGMGERK